MARNDPYEDEETYEKIAPKAVEEVLLQSLNNALVGDPHANWAQIATAAAIAKLAIAIEESNQQ